MEAPAAAALDFDLPHPDELFVAGRWVAPHSDARADAVAPFDGQVIANLPVPDVEDAGRAVAAAVATFDAWNGASLEDRLEPVSRFCAALDARREQISRLWAAEAGMALATATDLTNAASDFWNKALADATSLPWSEVREDPLGRVEVRREGIGPTVAIVAFNGPHMQFALAVIPGLLAGNTMVIKLPPEVRALGHLFAEAAEEAGFPEGVISILAADADVSRHLVSHRDVAAVHFTGGTEVGRSVMQACADRVAHVTLELGGKSAAIVVADADLDVTIPQLVDCMAMYSGQICVTMSRLLVAREIHDEVVERLVEGLAALTIGNPLDPETTWGPLASERYRERAEGYIERAVAAGATIAYGGKRPEGFEDGCFLEPTLLTNVTNDMEVAQDEIFGPVYCVIPFDDLEEAVRLANDSRYGLSGSIFTTDEQRGLEVARRVRSGVFIINATFPCLVGPERGVEGRRLAGLGAQRR
jgi:betaine-aldehyde dehydrogenase